MSSNTLTTGDLNALWQNMLKHRAVIRQSMIDYAVKIGVDESERWKNPFRKHLERYDADLLNLQFELTSNLILAHKEENGPNIDIDVPTVVMAMVDALTNEESDTTTQDKPLVFDAQWVTEYVHDKFFAQKEDVAYRQLVSKVYHLIGDFRVEGASLVIPFYKHRWFGGSVVSDITKELLDALDNLIQVVCLGANASDVEPCIFQGYEGGSKEHLSDFVLGVEKPEASITFTNPEHAETISVAILEIYPNQ